MSMQMQALIEALRGADPTLVRQLRDAVAAVPEDATPVNPCDYGHEWSDTRKAANGKAVRRSCTRCGVLALHTGEQHGELRAEEQAEAPVADAVAAALAAGPVARNAVEAAAVAAEVSKPKRKKSA